MSLLAVPWHLAFISLLSIMLLCKHLPWPKTLKRSSLSIGYHLLTKILILPKIISVPKISILSIGWAAVAAKSLQLCLTLCDPIRQPTKLPRPWDSPGKNTGVGCHFLLQCMKVISESEVTQSSPTLRDPMDCSLPGFSAYGIFQARVLEWVVIGWALIPNRFEVSISNVSFSRA